MTAKTRVDVRRACVAALQALTVTDDPPAPLDGVVVLYHHQPGTVPEADEAVAFHSYPTGDHEPYALGSTSPTRDTWRLYGMVLTAGHETLEADGETPAVDAQEVADLRAAALFDIVDSALVSLALSGTGFEGLRVRMASVDGPIPWDDAASAGSEVDFVLEFTNTLSH